MITCQNSSSNKNLNEDKPANNTEIQMAQLKRENAILKGRQLISDAIKNLNSDPIIDFPLEYVIDCTHNFQVKLGEGGAGDVFLATDKNYPLIKYAAKRIKDTNIHEVKADAFRRELEVSFSFRIISWHSILFI